MTRSSTRRLKTWFQLQWFCPSLGQWKNYGGDEPEKFESRPEANAQHIRLTRVGGVLARVIHCEVVQ